MSKKKIRKMYKRGWYFTKDHVYIDCGNWLKRYFIKRTTKRKHKNLWN